MARRWGGGVPGLRKNPLDDIHHIGNAQPLKNKADELMNSEPAQSISWTFANLLSSAYEKRGSLRQNLDLLSRASL